MAVVLLQFLLELFRQFDELGSVLQVLFVIGLQDFVPQLTVGERRHILVAGGRPRRPDLRRDEGRQGQRQARCGCVTQ